MKKGKLLNSVNQINRKKRYEDYFDPEKTYLMTPHSRSLPKKKPFFGNKKEKKKSATKRRNSIIMKKQNKYSRSPHSKQKISRHEYSNHRDYDSPSRDNQQLDLILAEKPKNKKNGSLAEITIDKVYEKLKRNKLEDSINILQQALNSQPHNYDMNYLLGVCLLISGSYEQAINLFDSLLEKKTRKNIFLLLSVCYKKIEDFRQTETILNICLKKYPKYYEAYIYRGKLSLKLKRYRQAMVDFEKAISLHPEKHIAYIGRGDCLRLSQKYEEAKGVYTKALSLTKKNNISILLRRAICSIELKRFDPAFNDIEELLNYDPENSEALYFKGLIFNKQSKNDENIEMQNEAIICYEQAIKFNTNKKAVTRSIYEIAKIKIEHRDYYEALYTLERAQHLDIEEKVIRKFKLFTDGVTEMMKKNYEDGIKILSQLLSEDDKPLNNFLKPLIYSSRSYGYMSLSKFQQATEDLQLMESQYPLDLPNLYNKFVCEGIIACNSQKYEQALSYFSKAGKTMPSRVEPNFYKAVTLICFASKLIPKQMKDKRNEYIHSAIKTVLKVEKHIENNPSLFLVRGFLYYAIGDLEKALDDLDKCMSESIKHHSLNFYLNGLILGQLGKNQEAIDEFKKALNADVGEKIPEIYLNRAKSLLLIGQINSGFVDLQAYMSYRPSSPDIHIWAGHLLSYIGATEDAAKAYSNINNIHQNFDVLFYRAKCYMNSKDVISTISNLKQMLEVKYENKTFFDFQMLQSLRECSEQGQVDYKVILANMKQAKQKAQKTGEEKFGNLFKESEYQFYKGIMYFYAKDYEKAAKNFDRSLKIKENCLRDLDENSQDCLQFYKLSYNNLCYNYYEGIYNCGIAEIMGGNTMKGLKRIKYINERISEGQTKNQLELLAHTLQKQIKSQFDKKKAEEESEEAQLFPFVFENRLCSIFPEFVLPLSTPIRTRLFFCLPSVEKPDIKPCFNDKLFDQITMKIVEIKPQAPWIKRSEEGVIFTDDVLGCDVELSASSSSEEEQEEEEDQAQENYDEDNSFENGGNASEGNEGPGVMNPSQLRQFFKLDRNIQERLARLD